MQYFTNIGEGNEKEQETMNKSGKESKEQTCGEVDMGMMARV